MTFLGSIFIPTSSWIWAAGALLAAAFLLLVWSYRRAPGIGMAQRIAFCLKLLSVLVLVLCLTEPLWSGKRAKSGANLFIVIADNSGGMNVRDHGFDKNRGEILRAALNIDRADWLGALANNFQVRQYVFDSRLRRANDFSELVFDGKASAIGMTLRTVAERYRNKPVAGVLLMTDGNATDIAEQFYDLSDVPPVYPVVIGSAKPQKDISLAYVSVSQTSFEDAPVMVQAEVEASGYAGQTVEVELVEASGNAVEQQTWKVSRSDEKETFRFRVRPDRSGVLFYHLEVAEAAKDDQAIESETPAEATMANNKRTLVVDRGRGPYRVLYVTGRPNWEYKFLRRAISDDHQVQLIGLLRVARREPKFNWLGHRGERSNPLFRGFDN
ncbi:MAG: glutamine amidotransferase, partial [Planctomycetota bacterium]